MHYECGALPIEATLAIVFLLGFYRLFLMVALVWVDRYN